MFVHCSSPPLLRNDYIYNNVSAPSHIRQSVPEHAKGHLFNANVHCNIFRTRCRTAKKAVEDYTVETRLVTEPWRKLSMKWV